MSRTGVGPGCKPFGSAHDQRARVSCLLSREWAKVRTRNPRSPPRTRGHRASPHLHSLQHCLHRGFQPAAPHRGQRRIVPRDTPGGAAPSGLGAAPPRFACAPVTKVQGQERRAAKPRLAQALFFAPAAGTPRPAAPAREWPSAAAV